VVKAGDIVKVKVLEVDVARKRIALSCRMSDEPGPTQPRSADRNAARGNDRNQDRGARPAPRPQQAAPALNTAMADALKGLRRG
jgi:uncharacterized protein